MARSVEATSVAGFVQQLAVQLVGRGYYFFAAGVVPAHKDPARTDAKLSAKYGVGRSKWARARRKAAGLPNHAYLRYGRFFCLLSTHGTAAAGEPDFFAEEGPRVRDARKTPVRFRGYAVSFRGGHVHVRIDRTRYLELKSYLVEVATRRTTDEMVAEMRPLLAFENYAPVRSQKLCVLRAVNRARAAAGLPEVPRSAVPLGRRPVRPFEPTTARDGSGCGG